MTQLPDHHIVLSRLHLLCRKMKELIEHATGPVQNRDLNEHDMMDCEAFFRFMNDWEMGSMSGGYGSTIVHDAFEKAFKVVFVFGKEKAVNKVMEIIPKKILGSCGVTFKAGAFDEFKEASKTLGIKGIEASSEFFPYEILLFNTFLEECISSVHLRLTHTSAPPFQD